MSEWAWGRPCEVVDLHNISGQAQRLRNGDGLCRRCEALYIQTGVKPGKLVSANMVYAIRCPTSGYTKLGRSMTPWYRLEQIKRGAVTTPDQVDLSSINIVWSVPAEKIVERKLHDFFSSRRGVGEWFLLSPFQIWLARGLAIEEPWTASWGKFKELNRKKERK